MRDRRGLWVVLLVLLLGGLAHGRDRVDAWIDATVLPPLVAGTSVEVLDRHGTLLRPFLVADGRWRLAVGLDGVDATYIDMLVRYEDKRFWRHPGIDPVAMSRAVWQALRHGRIISGGSTLTMQVARILEDGPTGQMGGKLRQMRVALALERRLSKAQILTLYLNRAPFGGNLEGVRAASIAYFAKPPARLTPAQAALLVALPQSPEARRPDRDPAAARAARDRVLARMARDGILAPAEAGAALTEPAPAGRHDFPALAAHLAERAAAEDAAAGIHQLTLDAGLQAGLEALAAEAVRDAGARLQVAILVADHASGEILASVGSAAYAADARQGFVDMTRAPRSPGSTLKPLVYGLAFDRGLAHPETLIADRPVSFGGYAPQNFDGLFRGEVRVRRALQLSLNVPVVALLEAMGPQHLLTGLRRAGARPVLPGSGAPGLAVALGGVGLSLEDLVRLYGALGNGGTAIDLRARPDPSDAFLPHRLIDRAAAWQVADILRDTPRPAGIRGAGIAYKTGTSYGYRDAWAIGFDGRHVVGVWMGRADGTPVPGLFGAGLAAPVMFRAFERLKPAPDALPPPPPETLIVGHAGLPGQLRRFGTFETQAAPGPEIAFPPEGAVVSGERLVARVRDGAAPFTWLANGTPVGGGHRREIEIGGLGPGFSALTVIDAEGRAARVAFEMR
ncbi:Glycosyl transferase, family 51 [Oceanicola granulosus HTCC2516]|uniref:peptidoglycan glycosyltransferase n=1 Tax=Oceanicola granulosus (strain ATCC BAA-861 / DSM 15982 / KCTC 12143 / HTCC2516) TaxID=314256 RepID=Q2CK53_OCEGH|nr:penicillin-binding protein 1C [Oceanicola granulosus]EAR52936.1 Glycosyl transferase, family 51 [Oceanicola granulosus HTCC2516]